jgi:[ribosomal protein S5]-alanine N-acetyltransferase
MKVTSTIVGPHVTISPLLPAHVNDAYVGWLNNPEIIRFTEISLDETAESTRAYVRAAIKAPNAAVWRIMIDDGVHVGNIRLSNIRLNHRRAEVALMIGAQEAWGRGVGSSAIELIARYAFEELELHKLTAGILKPNIGSFRAFEKAGFHCEATLRQHAVLDNAMCDSFLMARFTDVANLQAESDTIAKE